MRSADKHLISSSYKNALKCACNLFALSSTIYDASNPKFIDIFTENIIENCLDFSINCRKLMELCEIRDQPLDARRWKYDIASNINTENSLKNATNKIIHSKNLQVVFGDHPDKVFQDSKIKDIVALYISVTTDKFPETHIDIFSLSWCFIIKIDIKDHA